MAHYWYMIVADMLLTLISIIFGLMLRLEIFNPGSELFNHYFRSIWPFSLLAIVIRPAFLYYAGVYRRIWRYATTPDFIQLVGSVLAGSVVLFVVTFFLFTPSLIAVFPRSLYFMEAMITVLLLSGLRILIKASERYPGDIDWKKTGILTNRRALIVGAGDSGISIARELKNNPQMGLRPVAFLDDDAKKIGMKTQGLSIFGPVIKLADIVRRERIDEVILAMPSAPEQTLKNVQHVCQNIAITCTTLPSLGSVMENSEETGDLSNSSLVLPMSMPDITAEEIQAVVRVMQSRNLSIGSQTVEFERLIASQAHSKYAVAVTNGTSALHLCMVAADIGPEHEVITTPFSFISSANCILFEKARPVFVDIDPVSLNMDPGMIEAAITERTRAILVVHIFGQPADMGPILDIADRHGLIVIEDACEAIGAEYEGRRVGAIGKAGAFAFYPNKQMTTGEGAALVTNDETWANLFKSLRNQGRDKFDGWLNHSRLGYNYRMSELNAAVGVVQLKRLDELLKKRDAVARQYNAMLAPLHGVKPLEIAPTTTRMSWFVYVVHISTGVKRDTVIDRMAKAGIPTRPYFTPIHLQPFYRERFGFKSGDFLRAEAAGESIIALPFHTNMKEEEIEVVCRALKRVLTDA
ncbi:MAG TPA: DegT/DnrJ/EryC1/StrS family aminotransferase [Syntrophorhabdaceae bacterium]|nr:DegT/DnrJ/EryC1/StrS family aminotransferase [Syntrophorhabdaceae bacterium]